MSDYPDGSSSESDPEQPKAYSDNASAGRPTLAALRRNSPTHRIIDDSRWYNPGNDFQHRILVPQYYYAESGQRYVPTSSTSDTSSMAMTGESRSYYDPSASSRAPSLISSGSTRRDSRSSVRTDSIGSVNHYRLEADDDDDRIVRVPEPRRGTLQCPWSPLGCEEWFSSAPEWETHYQAHFHGKLPRSIECPFRGCDETFQGERSRDAWRERWSHIITCRYRASGVKTRISRNLIGHLWSKGLISSAQEQELRQTGSLSTAGAYLESYSGSRDRRRERRPEDYRSPRNGGQGSGTSYLPRR